MLGTRLRALARWKTARSRRSLARWFATLVALAGSANASDVTVFDAPDLKIVGAGQVLANAYEPDGSVVIGGYFASVNGIQRNAIAKIRADGTVDPDWNPFLSGMFTRVYAIVVDAAGDVYAAGDSSQRIVKIDGSTGTIDTAWQPIVDRPVRALAIGPDGSIFAGGEFLTVQGTPRSHLAKLDPSTGALDAAWNVGTDGTVYALAATAAGALYVGGEFATVGGVARKNIARVGTAAGAVTDPVWNPQTTPAISPVHALAPSLDQRIYVAATNHGVGSFFGRFSTNGSGVRDISWVPSPDGPVNALALVSGAIYAAGDFRAIRGESHRYLARIPIVGDGHADASFNPVLDDSGYALAISSDLSRIEVGGGFARVGTAQYLATATLSTADGSVVTAAHDAEVPGWVYRIAAQPNGGVIVGGDFAKVDQQRHEHLFRLKPDRTLDTAWRADVSGSQINALLTGPDSAVYVAGPLSAINGTARTGIAKLSGATGDVDATWDASSNSTATALAWSADGDLFVGGLFTAIGGESRRYLAKLRADGSADPDWDPSPDNWIRALATGADGSLFAGGDFTHIGSLERHYIAKVGGSGTGAADSAWDAGAGFLIDRIVAGPDGAIYSQGVFDGTTDVSHTRVVKLDPSTGAVDPGWNMTDPSGNTVDGIAFDREGRMYVVGAWFAFGGSTASNLLRLSATTGAVDPDWNPKADYSAAVAVGSDDAIFVGGNLTTIGGLPRQVIAALSPDAIDDTALTITAIDPEPSHAGEPYTVSFRVDAPDGTPTGSVTISDDLGAGCGPVDLVDGEGSCEMVSADIGVRTLTGLYSSDSVVFNDATTEAWHLVESALTTIAITADTPDPSEVMDPFEIVAHVETVYPDGGPGPTGIVTFDDHAGFTCTASVDAAGNASCEIIPMLPGSQTWTASYSGDGFYDSSESAPETHTVSRRTVVMQLIDFWGTTVTTQPATFNVNFDGSNGIPDGSVTISDGTSSCTAEILFGIASCDLAFPHVGDREVVATYAGDDFYAPAESEPIPHAVVRAQTAVWIRSHLPLPSVPGQPVTVTVDAVVLPPGAGVPAGTLLVSGAFGQTECTIAASGGSCDLVYSDRGMQQLEADFVENDDFGFSVFLDLHRVNELPVAVTDNYASFEDQPLVVGAAEGVLVNDYDPDGDPLTIADPGETGTSDGGTVVLAADGSFTYTPPADGNGKATFTYLVSDGLETTIGEAVINVAAVNDPPTFTLAASPSFAPGTSGVQTTPSFATMTSAGPGEDNAPLAWHVRIVSDASGVLSAPATIALDGTLATPLTGHGGTATLAVALQDDGGTEHGGNDTSPEQTFTITVGDGTDLSVAIEDDTTFIAGGDAVAYRITVRNNGPESASGARVRAMLSANLVDAAWTCAAGAGASCTADGSGEIDDLADIAPGEAVVYSLIATTIALPELAAEIDATVSAPSGLIDFNPGNDSAIDVDFVGIFFDGFDTAEERPDVEAARAMR